MASTFLIILWTVISLISCQIYFPEDSERLETIPTNITSIRGTTVYEEYVNRIISHGVLKLTLAIDKAVVQSTGGASDNVVFAPVSIAAALALVLLGANGKTFQEISNIMGLATGVDIDTKSQLVHEQFGRMLQYLQTTSGFKIGSQVNFATAVFLQEDYPIRSAYKRTAEKVYESEVLNVDFKSNPERAEQIINAWVSDRTKGKIRELLNGPPSSNTRVILASAMYFMAEWEQPFFEQGTKRRPFYPDGRNSQSNVMVDMMTNGGDFPHYSDPQLDCEILGFPYKDRHTTMYVVMPNNSNREKLNALRNRLNYTEVIRLVDNVRYRGVVIIFPRMRIDSTLDLKTPLQLIGVHSLFNPNEANLALLSPGLQPLNRVVTSTGGVDATVKNPISPTDGGNKSAVVIFSRTGEPVDCSQIFNPNNNISSCEQIVNITTSKPKSVTYKRFGDKVGRRILSGSQDTIDNIREQMNKQAVVSNPGLYADTIIHRVFMDITETGTEAAAATAVSLSRDGSRHTFRVDVPFFFFIMHEQSKTVLFWGSVTTPTPSFK